MKRIFSSSKGMLALIALVLTTVLVAVGKLEASYFIWLVGVVVIGYQGSTALEDRAKKKKKQPKEDEEDGK